MSDDSKVLYLLECLIEQKVAEVVEFDAAADKRKLLELLPLPYPVRVFVNIIDDDDGKRMEEWSRFCQKCSNLGRGTAGSNIEQVNFAQG